MKQGLNVPIRQTPGLVEPHFIAIQELHIVNYVQKASNVLMEKPRMLALDLPTLLQARRSAMNVPLVITVLIPFLKNVLLGPTMKTSNLVNLYQKATM